MKNYFVLLIIAINCFSLNAQITLSVESQQNTECTGKDCIYEGPSILINEVMLSPATNDGSIWGTGPGFTPGQNQGEWIELYNPDKCKPVDISCYFLGNNTREGASTNYGGGFVVPKGTIVPPRGFCVIRGIYAPPVPSNLLVKNGGNTVEIIVTDALAGPNVCIGTGYRLWFPNGGGWFAFYDNNGVPQDAISWSTVSNSCTSCSPCNPGVAGCYLGILPAYDNIPANKKNYITSINPKDYAGLSLRRTTDGGGWSAEPSYPTLGNCNSTCIPAPVITCTGKAWVTAGGGIPPYSYKWDDAQQTNQETANGLCAGIYKVTVTDSEGAKATASVIISDIAIEANISHADLKCYQNNSGSISTSVSTGTPPYKYQWSNGGTSQNINNISAGNYSVTITDKNGCMNVLSTDVAEPAQIILNTTVDSVRCFGEQNGSILAMASGGTPPYSYLWDTEPPQDDSIAVNLPEGVYNLTLTDNNGCIKNIPVQVFQPDSIFASFLASPDSGKAPLIVNFTYNGQGASKFNWSFGDGAKDNNPFSTTHTFKKGGKYKVILTITSADNNCSAVDTVEILVSDNPSDLKVKNDIITLNGDDKNKALEIDFNLISVFSCKIFNRWGELIVEVNDIKEEAWDGKNKNGKEVSEGVYFYIITARGIDDVDYNLKGSVTLVK